MLVEPLPAGAKLVVRRCCSSMIIRTSGLRFYPKAIFDACNSATLLGNAFHELLRESRDSNSDLRSGTLQVQQSFRSLG